jgi:hypothetical protein
MNQKAFTVGDKVMFQCPFTKDIIQDEIVYIGRNTIEGKRYDLSYLYLKKRLTKIK